MNVFQTLIEELQAKGYGPGTPVSERSLRQDYTLPSWVGVPPDFVTLLNEHLGTVTVGPEPSQPKDTTSGQSASPSEAEPDIFNMFVDVLGGFGGGKNP